MTNQLSLSKAALKSTSLLLAHFEARQADTLATIATLKRILAESGVTTNGVTSNGHGAPLDGPTKAERIVKKAQARFAAKHHRPAKPDRLSPAAWRARIVDILTHRGAPMAVRDLQRQVGQRSNNIFKHLTAAVKAGVISRAPGPKGFYVLGRLTASQARRAKAPKKSGLALNVKRQRQFSLDLLNTFSTETPKPLGVHAGRVSKLISHGYLKRTRDGYLRTDKVYEVTPS